MGKIALQYRQRHGAAYAVVGSERGLVGPDPLAVGDDVYGFGRHVLLAVGGLDADHVHVPLQDNGLGILVALAAVLEDDHVAGLILDIPQPVALREIAEQPADEHVVPAAVRHGAKIFEIFKYFPGTESR